MSGFAIVLNRCPHGVEMISLDNEGGGTNLTGPDCCGRWSEVKAWPMSARKMRCAIDELEDAASRTEQENQGQ